MCFRRIIALAAAVPLMSCGGGGNGGAGGESSSAQPTNSPEVSRYLNGLSSAGIRFPREIGDERALIIEDSTQQTITTYKGQKSIVGNLTDLTRIETTKENGNSTSIDYITPTSRVIKVNGETTITLISSGVDEWVVEFVDNATGTSFRTTMPSAMVTTSSAALSERHSRALAAVARYQGESVRSAPLKQASTLAPSSNSNAQIPVTVKTSNCGQTADAQGRVRLVLNDASGKYLGDYSTTKAGVGTYVGHVPDIAKETQVSLDTVKSAIETTALALSLACTADKASPLLAAQACTTIATTISSTGIGAPIGAQFFAACQAAVAVGKLACAAYDKINLPVPDYVDPASADILPTLDKILVSVLPDSIFNSTVTPYIEALPSNVYGNSVQMTGSSPLSTSIDQQSLVVEDIILSPANPGAFTSYDAIARLQCIPFSSSASLSVLGTDEYSDSAEKTWASTTQTDTIELNVPGGSSGIRDSLTLTVTPRIGSTVTRKAFLVFQ